MHLLKHVPKSTRHLNTEVHLNRGVKSQELLPWKHTEESECFERDTCTPKTLLHIPWGNTDFETGTGPDAFRLGLVHVEFWQTWQKWPPHPTFYMLTLEARQDPTELAGARSGQCSFTQFGRPLVGLRPCLLV